MTTGARVRAARDLFRFLGSAQTDRSPGAFAAVLDELRVVAPFDCGCIIEWDAVTDRQPALANRDYPVELLQIWESYLHREPLFLGMRVDAPVLRVRDVPPRERGGIIYDEIFVRPGFAEGLTLRLWADDGRYVGTMNANVIGTSQPDDLAVDLLGMLAPRLGALLDPLPAPLPMNDDLAAGRADALLVTRHGRVRCLTAGAEPGLARPDGPLWPVVHPVANGRTRSDSAIVLAGDRVLSVSLRAGRHGALLLHRAIPAPFGLSMQELRILDALGDGATNRALAVRFGIAPRTVATYVERLLIKTGCPNRTAATALAARLNLTVCPL